VENNSTPLTFESLHWRHIMNKHQYFTRLRRLWIAQCLQTTKWLQYGCHE